MEACASKEGYIERGGTKLFYRRKGNPVKPLIVFVHGNNTDSRIWSPQQEAFCQNYQTLAIDMRGFGKSSKTPPFTVETHEEDLYYLLEELKVPPFYLVGWSLGGLVAQSYVVSHPEKVKKLVLVASAPQLVSSPGFPFGGSPRETEETLRTILNDFPAYISDATKAMVPEECPGNDKVRAKIASMIEESGPEVLARQLSESSDFSSAPFLEEITTPTLILVGMRDEALNPKASSFLNLYIPKTEIFEFPDAGHVMFLTYRETFNKKLHQFLSGEVAPPCRI